MKETPTLGLYLGCPIIDGKVTSQTFNDIVTTTRNTLSKWKVNSLSLPGRAVLLPANVASKASYQMQSFLLPSSIHSELDKIYRNFLWNKDPDKKSPNLIGWDMIYKPRNLGGLGIRKTEASNKALQMKLLWKILTQPDNLWVKLVKKRYVHD